jgi:hypothetical protein
MKNTIKMMVNGTVSAIESCSPLIYGSIEPYDTKDMIGPLNTVYIMRKAEKAFFYRWVDTGSVMTPKIGSFFSADDLSNDIYISLLTNHYGWKGGEITCYSGRWRTAGFSCALIKSSLHDEKIFIMDYFTSSDLVPFKLGERDYDAKRPRTLIMFVNADGFAHWATEIRRCDPPIREISPTDFKKFFKDDRRTADAVRHIHETIYKRSFMKLLKKGDD